MHLFWKNVQCEINRETNLSPDWLWPLILKSKIVAKEGMFLLVCFYHWIGFVLRFFLVWYIISIVYVNVLVKFSSNIWCLNISWNCCIQREIYGGRLLCGHIQSINNYIALHPRSQLFFNYTFWCWNILSEF